MERVYWYVSYMCMYIMCSSNSSHIIHNIMYIFYVLDRMMKGRGVTIWYVLLFGLCILLILLMLYSIIIHNMC